MTATEEPSRDQSCLPTASGTSKKSSEDATSSAGALATILRANNPTLCSPKATKPPHQTSNLSRISTRYRTTHCDPEVLGLIRCSEASKVDLSTEAELDQDRDTRPSEDLEIVNSPDSAQDTNFASVFAPLRNHSSSSANLSTFRVQGFQHFKEDGTSEKLYTVISNQSTDIRLELFSEFFNLQSRSDFFRTIMSENHDELPNMEGAKSLFTPEYSLEDLSSAKSPGDHKVWELGFKTSIFQRSERNSPTNTPALKRYKMIADQRTFDLFQTEGHVQAREKAAWIAVSSTSSPNSHHAAVSPGFEKLATDFFGGEEVQEDHSYALEGDARPINRFTRANNHGIAYIDGKTSDAIWEELRNNPVFARFIIDVTMSNDMEKARHQGSRWYGAKVYCFIIDHKSDKIELVALLDALKGMTGKASKPSDLEEYNTSGAPDFSALHIYEVLDLDTESNRVPDTQDNNAPSTSQLSTESKEKSKEQSHDQDDWMAINRDQQAEKASKKASKKGDKNRSKAMKKKHSQVGSTLNTESDDEPRVSEKPDVVLNAAAPKSSLGEEEAGDWSLVPKKVPSRQGRPMNGSSTAANRGTMSGSSGFQSRQPGSVPNQNRSHQVPLNSFSAQFQRENPPNTAKLRNAAVETPFVASKAGSVPSQKVTVTQSSEKSAPMRKPGPKSPKASRIFVPEEYPALATKASISISLSTVKPTSQTGTMTKLIKSTSVIQGSPKPPSRLEQITQRSENKSVSTPTGTALIDIGGTNKCLEVDTSPLLKTTIDKSEILPIAGFMSLKTTDSDSGNTSAGIDYEEVGLDSEDREKSFCEAPSPLLRKAEVVEPFEDGEYSEHSSTTVQTDIAPLPMAGLNAKFKRSDDGNYEHNILAAIAVAEDRAPFYTEKEDESETDKIANDESEDSRDDTSSADILTSPSQHNISALSRSNLALNDGYFEVSSSENSPSTLKAQLQSHFPIQHEDGVSKIGLDTGIRQKEDVSFIFYLKGGQSIEETSSIANEEECVNIARPSTQAPSLASSNHSFLLLTEAEASRVVSTKKIKIRSATHSSSGVKIPNFYSISSDGEDSDTEMASSKSKPSKIASTKVPNIRSAKHSAKTGVAISNFFYVSSDDEDSDVENVTVNTEDRADVMNRITAAFVTNVELSDGNHTQEFTTAGYTESPLHIVDAPASDTQMSLLPPDDGHIQEPAFAVYADPAPSFASEFKTSRPSLNNDHAQEVMDLAFVLNATALDDQVILALSDGSYTQEVTDHAPITTTTALDNQMSILISGGNCIQDFTCSNCTEQASQEHVMNGTTSGLERNFQSPNEDLAQRPVLSAYKESFQDSTSHVSHDTQPAQPNESFYHPRSLGSRLAIAPSTPGFCQGPPLLDHRHLVLPRNAYTSFGSGVETAQPILHGGSPYKQAERQYTRDGTVDSQNLDRSKDPSQASTDGMAAQTQRASQFTANCTYCRQRTTPSIQTPQVLCSGCGPTSMIRYCSVACLLVDSIAHSGHCMNYVACDRAAFHDLPGMFIYITTPITSELGYLETPERFRQRAFSMYCSSGPYPKLFMAWMKKSTVILSVNSSIDPNETVKRTGDYAVFRSNVTLDPPRNNPNADVIYTIKFHRDDPKKQMLGRTLNACFLVWDNRVIEFLYRLLRHFILDPEYFSIFKYTEPLEVVWREFEHQFKNEFNFDASMQTCTDPNFNGGAEWQWISGLIANLEYRYLILSQWFRH